MAHAYGACHEHAVTINILPDDIFLDIFAFCLRDFLEDSVDRMRKWQRLAHVCQRWRRIIYASPRHLDLLLCCSRGRSVRNLSCWPAFPIALCYDLPYYEDEVFAALEHLDRVRRITLTIKNSQLGKTFAAMQGPFPVLKHLHLFAMVDVPVLPSGFLSGPAPCLQHFYSSNVPFSELPALLLSSRDLVSLHLHCIPPTGYISPEAMVACLAVLPRLYSLAIEFDWQAPPTDHIHLPPEARVVLPALTSFIFGGESAYLNAIMTQIDAPRLDLIDIACHLNFQVTDFSRFILDHPTLKPSRVGHAEIYFEHRGITFYFYHQRNPHQSVITIRIPLPPYSFAGTHEQVSDMALLLSQNSAMLSDVVRLEIRSASSIEGMRDIEWLELLRPFTAVETLRVSLDFAESVVHSLEGLTVEMATQVLPALSSLYLQGQHAANINKLTTILRGCGRPVIISDDCILENRPKTPTAATNIVQAQAAPRAGSSSPQAPMRRDVGQDGVVTTQSQASSTFASGSYLSAQQSSSVRQMPHFPSVEEVLDTNSFTTVHSAAARELWGWFVDYLDALLDSVRFFHFDQFEMHIRSFWTNLSGNHREVAHSPAIAGLMAKGEAIVYDEILELLCSQLLSSIPTTSVASLRQLADKMERVLLASLEGYGNTFVDPKVELGARFGHLVILFLDIYQVTQTLNTVLASQEQLGEMRRSWEKIDFNFVRNQLALVCNCRHEDVKQLLEVEFRGLMDGLTKSTEPVRGVMAWADECCERLMGPDSGTEERGTMSWRSVLIRWVYATNQIMKDLTVRSDPTFGAYQLLKLFLDDWIALKVLRNVALSTTSIAASVAPVMQQHSITFSPKIGHDSFGSHQPPHLMERIHYNDWIALNDVPASQPQGLEALSVFGGSIYTSYPQPSAEQATARDVASLASHSMYRRPPSVRSHALSAAGSPDRPPSRIALERAIEVIQTQLAALSERIELIELQSSGTRQSASPSGLPRSSRSSSGSRDIIPWNLDEMGLWAIVFKGMARVLASLRQLAVFLFDSEGRSPTFVVLRQLLLDLSSILCTLALAKTVWKRIRVRRRKVNAAIRALWWAVVGKTPARSMADRGI